MILLQTLRDTRDKIVYSGRAKQDMVKPHLLPVIINFNER